MEQSVGSLPARAGGEFFAAPTDPTQRRYEALRCYLYEGASAAEVADRFGYTVDTVRTLVRDFRAGRRGFFVAATPGPKSAPVKDAARDRVIEVGDPGAGQPIPRHRHTPLGVGAAPHSRQPLVGDDLGDPGAVQRRALARHDDGDLVDRQPLAGAQRGRARRADRVAVRRAAAGRPRPRRARHPPAGDGRRVSGHP